jgi:hypothetical protein
MCLLPNLPYRTETTFVAHLDYLGACFRVLTKLPIALQHSDPFSGLRKSHARSWAREGQKK